MHQKEKTRTVALKGRSPIKVDRLVRLLKLFPQKMAAESIRSGFTQGYTIGYRGPRQAIMARNQKSVRDRMDIARQKIQQEIDLGRVAGPFDTLPFPHMRISPLGLVEKSQKGKFRLIHNLSFPQGNSVNEYIDDADATVRYLKFDEAVEMIAAMGAGARIAKADLKDAFRLLPINRGDFDLLGFSLDGKYYYDMCLPMGLKISCRLFEEFSTFLNWFMDKLVGEGFTCHYLDDWLFISPQGQGYCMHVLTRFLALCRFLGIPVADEKTVLPCTCLTFLGLQIDTVKQEVQVPADKLSACILMLHRVRQKTSISLRELQCLLGHLNFLSRGVRGGRPFLQRLVNLSRGLSSEPPPIYLSDEAKADIDMWVQFLGEFNGTVIILPSEWLSSEVLHLYTDAAKSMGFGAFFRGGWFKGSWAQVGVNPGNSIAYLEYVPVLLALLVWGTELANTKIIFHSDNKAVVQIINRQSSRCVHIMKLVRRLTRACLHHNILLKGRYIRGAANIIADSLSRFDMHTFFQEVPTADVQPTP